MTAKPKVRRRVTFAPGTKTDTEQLDNFVRAVEFKGPGIDELSNMIQNIHIGYTANKRKPSFDSSSIIQQLRSTLDSMLDSELAETSFKSSSSDNESIKDDITSPKSSLSSIDEINERQFKSNHDSGVSDIEFDLEKIKNNEVSPQARRRVSGLINKLDICINELQRVTDTIEEETPSELQALNDNIETGKEALPSPQISMDTNVNRTNHVNSNTNVNNYNSTTENVLYSEPYDAGYYTATTTDYLYNGQDLNDYTMSSTNEMSRLDRIRKGIFAIPNQPTVIEACYSGFLLSSILTVVSDECSVLYFGILTENNLYFYNSTNDDEPMFGRIVIDQYTKVLPITTLDNQEFLIEITGVYVLPDNQVINSKVRIKFSNKQERNIWYKVIKTTVNDWKIKASYMNNNYYSSNAFNGTIDSTNVNNTVNVNDSNSPSPTQPNGGKRRLSFLSSIHLQPLYMDEFPKRVDSLNGGPDYIKPVTKKSSELSESTLISPEANETTNSSGKNSSNASTPTMTSEENYGYVNPSQSILSALHVLEALERKRNNQKLKK